MPTPIEELIVRREDVLAITVCEQQAALWRAFCALHGRGLSPTPEQCADYVRRSDRATVPDVEVER